MGMALPLIRYLYDRPGFLWVSMASAAAVGLLLVVAPVRARVSLRRKVLFSGLAAGLALAQVVSVYLDFGAPPLWTAGPEILAVFREMVHILLYGFLAFAASRFSENGSRRLGPHYHRFRLCLYSRNCRRNGSVAPCLPGRRPPGRPPERGQRHRGTALRSRSGTGPGCTGHTSRTYPDDSADGGPSTSICGVLPPNPDGPLDL